MKTLQLASVELRVPDLARSVEFYSGQLGLSVVTHYGDHAELAVEKTAPVLLVLTEARTASPAPRDAAGLFHAALLLRHRSALGQWLRTAADRGIQFDGFSDHGVSEAIYLSDPDGNGLEIYADRPRTTWPFAANGEVAMTTQPLEVPSLLATASPATESATAGARWGHLHLRVTDLARSEAFYRTTLGLVVTQSTYPGARFLAANGYHHHLGLNTWGAPRRPQPAGALGLAAATFRGPGLSKEARVSDPDGISLRLLPAPPRIAGA